MNGNNLNQRSFWDKFYKYFCVVAVVILAIMFAFPLY